MDKVISKKRCGAGYPKILIPSKMADMTGLVILITSVLLLCSDSFVSYQIVWGKQ